MIRFVYFDFGNVLVYFSVPRLLKQVRDVVDANAATIEQMSEVVFGSGLENRFETGLITEAEFLDEFQSIVGKKLPVDKLRQAVSDIFSLNQAIFPVLQSLNDANVPRGILSNTSIMHWEFCKIKYPIVHELIPSNHVLSYEAGSMKPEQGIYKTALQQVTKVMPSIQSQEILFIDDLEHNVQAAKKFGFDAVRYTDTKNLTAELKKRGLEVG
ncbi:MAG: HAD family phosphatase [Planctomycetaceae bacterium]|jgi:FMN phosphatase YigB (HAD superfamily)|nr:HAD family phosphatase [Planctomycetaceae bacterium]